LKIWWFPHRRWRSPGQFDGKPARHPKPLRQVSVKSGEFCRCVDWVAWLGQGLRAGICLHEKIDLESQCVCWSSSVWVLLILEFLFMILTSVVLIRGCGKKESSVLNDTE
jgi:hypothetical protein